jgi:hypothetical protein
MKTEVDRGATQVVQTCRQQKKTQEVLGKRLGSTGKCQQERGNSNTTPYITITLASQRTSFLSLLPQFQDSGSHESDLSGFVDKTA